MNIFLCVLHSEIRMHKQKGRKLKNVCMDENIHLQTDASMIDDDGFVLNKAFNSLTICLKTENDYPHPRHLCFTYPFGKFSHKRYCSKCYCYVCEQIAPCKMWRKSPKRHCDATDKDDKWRIERQLKKKLSGATTMVYHTLTLTACFDPPMVIAGGLICNKDQDWITGIRMCLPSNVNLLQHSVPFYFALLKVLALAWSRGHRYLQVKLGFVFHDCFWLNFTKDSVNGKFRLAFDKCHRKCPRKLMMQEVEDYLNRDWFIDVKNTETFKEETGALAVTALSDMDEEAIYVYDLRKHPSPEAFKDIANYMAMDESIAELARTHGSAKDKVYFGVN